MSQNFYPLGKYIVGLKITYSYRRRQFSCKNKNGIILVTAIIMIGFVTIAVLGLTMFIAQRFQEEGTRQAVVQDAYLAMAGINQALYNFRTAGSITLGTTNINANNSFVLGGTQADGFIMDTSTAAVANGGKDLVNLSFRTGYTNHSGNAILTKMSFVFSNSNVNLKEIKIGGTVRWTGNISWVGEADIQDVTVYSSSTNIDYFRFGGDITNQLIFVQLFFSDGSMLAPILYLYGIPTNSYVFFKINATGQMAGSNLFRTIQATYNPLFQRIILFQEIDTHM